jgi:hypothetical protein
MSGANIANVPAGACLTVAMNTNVTRAAKSWTQTKTTMSYALNNINQKYMFHMQNIICCFNRN